jgi:abnormal spindle-like microcephaly-associated protein
MNLSNAAEAQRCRLDAWARLAGMHVAAMRLQRWWRYKRQQAKAQGCAAISLQSAVRGWLARHAVVKRLHAARTIQKAFRRWQEKRKGHRLHAAATVVQAAYRSYRIRRTMNAKLKEIHRRVVAVNATVQAHMTLGQRARSALEILLTHKQLTFVLRAVANLDTVTLLSRTCCEQLVKEQQAVPILMELIRSCNRSKPHMAVLSHTLNILLHLCAHKCTFEAVFATSETLSMLADLLQMYRDKDDIFGIACQLLVACCQDERRRQLLRASTHAVNRIRDVVRLLEVGVGKQGRGSGGADGIAAEVGGGGSLWHPMCSERQCWRRKPPACRATTAAARPVPPLVPRHLWRCVLAESMALRVQGGG